MNTNKSILSSLFLLTLLLTFWSNNSAIGASSLIAPGATLITVQSGFSSAEGPAADADGNIYFSDIRAGRIWKWTWKDGKVSLYKEKMLEPNGVIGTSDGKTLYVADWEIVWSYKIQPDGSLTDRKFFCKENSDGFTVDENNNLYCTGEKISIYNPKGEIIEEIAAPASNLTFGGKDRKTLFITAHASVYTLEMAVKGAPTALDLARGK
jgi:sugar lactone lactonase YvrE